MRLIGRSLRAFWVALASCAAGCQLVYGIDDIALSPDGSSSDGAPFDTTTSGEGQVNPDASGTGDAGGADAGDAAAGESGGDGNVGPDAEGGGGPLPYCVKGMECYAKGTCGGPGCCEDGGEVSCGSMGAACCPGNPNGKGSAADYCDGLGTMCGDAGVCVACGGSNQPCCPLGFGCTFLQCCDLNTFTCANSCSCGGNNQPCCANDQCGGLNIVCVNGTCQNCGGGGEPCCAGASCRVGTCNPNTDTCNADGGCGPCGGVGESCCSGSSCAPSDCCDNNATCVAGGAKCSNGYLCVAESCACGVARGSSCCSGNTCTGTHCCDIVAGTCVNDGEPCTSPSTVCSGGMCKACGGTGQPCCAHAPRCNPGTCQGGTCT